MKKAFPVLLLLACAALFVGTFYVLLKGRFDEGDVYPPSSSLRSDPLGTMIFFESLQALPGLQVTRDYSAVNRLPEGKNTTYLHFAADSADWDSLSPEIFRTLDQFLIQGGRLVLTLSPEYLRRRDREKKDVEKKDADDSKKPEKKETEDDDDDAVSLREKWGLSFSLEPDSENTSGESLAKNVSSLALPPEMKWHGELIIKDPGPAWTVVYRNPKGPVMAEMKRGPGSVVVATDSYFVSNEALVRDRQPALLAWLVGSSDHIVFDEAHLGIMESPGIAALARKYRLYGGVAALLALAGLFIWKNSRSLAPPHPTTKVSADTIVGRNAAAGFIGLLRRNIPADRVLEVCLQEWRKSFGHLPRFSPREKAALEEIFREENARPARERDPVATYQKIHAALHRGASKPSA